MANDADEDSTPPVPSAIIGHIDNRSLLAVLGNIVIEQQQHGDTLKGLYNELRALAVPAPKAWAFRLLDELDRHHQKDAANIYAFRGVAEGT